MALMELRDVTIRRGAETMLENVSFSVNDGDRIGLIGSNGTGKTTLFRILAGVREPDTGRVIRRSSLKVGWVEQELPAKTQACPVRHFLLDGLSQDERAFSEYRVDMILDDLHFVEELRSAPLNQLSGGWRRLAMIARVMLQLPDVLLLDEPSNHLDLEKLLILETWLNEHASCPYILSGHDREFLDRCTNSSIILHGGRAQLFRRSFSAAMAEVETQRVAAARRRAVEEKIIDRLEASAKRLAVWGKVFDNPDLSRRAKAIETRIQHMRDDLTWVAPADRRKITIAEAAQSASRVVEINAFALEDFGGSVLIKIDGFTLRKGDKLILFGGNGSGKTTFLRQLADAFVCSKEGLNPPDARFVFNPQAVLVYLDQDLGLLALQESVFGFLDHRTTLSRTDLTRRLVQAGFDVRVHGHKIQDLSHGQRARLAFLLLDLLKPNFYLLDEPTNHLDIAGREWLEAELLKPSVTCILTTHDRRMLRTIGNRFAVVRDRQLQFVESPSNYLDTAQGEREPLGGPDARTTRNAAGRRYSCRMPIRLPRRR